MNKFLKVLDSIISWILIVLVAFLAVGITVTIVLRYFFGLSFSTLEEFLTMSFIFTTLFGSALAIREKQHIAIAFLSDSIAAKSKTAKIVTTILIDASIIFIALAMTIISIQWIRQVGHLLSANSHLPMGVYYVFVPITFSLTVFYAIIDILSLFLPIQAANSGYTTDDKLPGEDK